MLHEVKFTSFNERDQVYGWIYVPACKPLGIIQLIHGFGEHSRRDLHMITSFMEAGYIVAADDHVGHGKTALENNTWGNWGDKGFTTMMEDEKKLHDLVVENIRICRISCSVIQWVPSLPDSTLPDMAAI